MPVLLRDLPFFDEPRNIHIGDRSYRIHPRQIIVWVSLSPKGMRELDPRTPRFPAVLDTGFTDTFLIHQEQLRSLGGFLPEHLTVLNSFFHVPGRRIPVHAANLWLHFNRPGSRDEFRDVSPFLMELPRGIGICADADIYPRLPLLGARALCQSQLHLFVDYERFRVSLRTSRKFWFFG